MTVSIPDFWRLAVESRLLAPADCQQLEANFAGVKGAAAQSNAATLGEWLIANGVLTRYQIKTLLAGHAGPFFYGDYYVYDRIRSKEGRLGGLLRAVHIPTRHPVMLYFITGMAAQDPQWWAVALQQVAWACSAGHPFVSQCYQLLDLGQYKVVALEDLLGDPATAGAERPAGASDNTLAARFTAGNRLAPADACRLAYQVGSGLARLHQLGQVHGSVWPENVWLSADGTAKLLQSPLAPEPAMGPRRSIGRPPIRTAGWRWRPIMPLPNWRSSAGRPTCRPTSMRLGQRFTKCYPVSRRFRAATCRANLRGMRRSRRPRWSRSECRNRWPNWLATCWQRTRPRGISRRHKWRRRWHISSNRQS